MRKLILVLFVAGSISLGVWADPSEEAPAVPPAPGQAAPADAKEKKPDYPPFDKVIEGLTKVVSTIDGSSPLFDLYKDDESGRLLAVLPAKYDQDLYMVASTVSGGDPESGVMGPTHFIKWRKVDKQIAVIEPNLYVRTDGDEQAKKSVDDLYTGRLITALPIKGMTPDKRPVIDLGTLGSAQVSTFFAYGSGRYGVKAGTMAAKVSILTKAKAFPENVIFEYEIPRENGNLIRVTHAISKLEGTPGFKPRKADPRVGYFYDFHLDYARTAKQDITSRYINRWCLEKADADLAISPPKKPIVWYIEHTTPIRFRRYVREGILWWNDAYREIGFDNAVEVYQQDASTGAHMDKDPEDARYNFFRWNASDQAYAIGPSRSNPLTGEILDADIVWHQGLTRALRGMFERVTEDFVLRSFGPETLAWFDEHPNWDPRVRLAGPTERAKKLRERTLTADTARSIDLYSPEHPWMHGALRNARNMACEMGSMLSLEIGLADAAMSAGMLETGDAGLLDGLPENYIGPMIRYVSAHEVGHCLGLQHNMAGSSRHSLKEINSPDFDGPLTASIMDYVSPNVNYLMGEVQGPYITDRLGGYDYWVIAYGYGPEDKLEEVLARVNEPDNLFVSQLAIYFGGDPRNNTWDLGADSLNFATERLGIVRKLRASLLEKQVKEGDPWTKARTRLSMLNGVHLSALQFASVWIGGTYINNNFKGDPGEQPPNTDVPADKQRESLRLIMDNSFEDEAYGVTTDLLRHLARDYWFDPEALPAITTDPSFPVHDFVGGIQATALTLIMNPTKLRRVYDNEFRANGTDDVFTLAEMMQTITDAVWRECAGAVKGEYSAKSPMISGFRRNLQQEHVRRLVDLTLLHDASSPSTRTVGTLAADELRRVDETVTKALEIEPDAYSRAHLSDIRARIAKAQKAAYVIGK